MARNFKPLVADLRALKPVTAAGMQFVNESMTRLNASKPSLRLINFILESAAASKDVTLNAFARKHSKALGKQSFGYVMEMYAESLAETAEPGSNMEAAAEAVDALVSVPQTDAIYAIAVEHALDNFNMYPEVAAVIKAAKEQYFASVNSADNMLIGKSMLVVIEGDFMGWHVTKRWYSLQEGTGKLVLASALPSAEAQAVLAAVSMMPFDHTTNRFKATTCIGDVEIVGKDAIMFENATITTENFVERVQGWLATNGANVAVNDDLDAVEALNNAVVVIATNWDMLSVLSNSIYNESYNTAVYVIDGMYNVISTGVHEINSFNSAVDCVNFLTDAGMPKLADFVRETWKDSYDAEVVTSIKNDAQAQLLIEMRDKVRAHIDAALGKQQLMDATSEGFAAYQQVIDQYNAQLNAINDKLIALGKAE